MWAQRDAPGRVLKVSLAREFRERVLQDMSPDGLKICFEYWGDARYPIEVAEIETGKTVFSGAFETRVWDASFFSNSKAFVAETLRTFNGRIVGHRTVVDLLSGERAEEEHFPGNPYDNNIAEAVSDRTLLVADIDRSSRERSHWALVEFPDFREITRVPWVLQSSEREELVLGGNRLSDDRSVLVYTYGQTVVCRRTKDLAVLWTTRIKPPVKAKEVTTSSNGRYVAVAIADTGFQDEQKEYYISIINGETGVDVARLPLSGTEGLALSPDGSLLAVVDVISNKTSDKWVPTVHIHEVSSGKRLASVIHDRYDKKKVRTIYSGCSVHFTSDGKYLVTSGINTKVWKLSIQSSK